MDNDTGVIQASLLTFMDTPCSYVDCIAPLKYTWTSTAKFKSKGDNAMKDLLVAPKDKDNISSKGGVIYRYKCHHLGCTVEYIGDTGRIFGDRYK